MRRGYDEVITSPTARAELRVAGRAGMLGSLAAVAAAAAAALSAVRIRFEPRLPPARLMRSCGKATVCDRVYDRRREATLVIPAALCPTANPVMRAYCDPRLIGLGSLKKCNWLFIVLALRFEVRV